MINKDYTSPKDSGNQLSEGKARIEAMLKQAKLQHLGQLSNELGNALSKDQAVADMPPIRVVKKKRGGHF